MASAGPTIRAYLPQQSYSAITWTGTWTKLTDVHCSGGSVRSASTLGARATYSFSGRAVAWVSTVGPGRGSAKVYLDGTYITTVDLAAATTTFGRVVFAKTWAGSGFHTIRIVVATAGQRVDVDAFEVLR